MNFINAVVEEKDGGLALKIGSDENPFYIPIPEAKVNDAVKAKVGQEVIMGIRPEDLHDEEEAVKAAAGSTIKASIRVYEMLGAEVFLYFDVEENSCTARVNPRTTARPGDTVEFALDLSKVHIFDKETEKVILN